MLRGGNNRFNQGRTQPRFFELTQRRHGGATRGGHHIFEFARMQLLFLK